MARIRTSIVDRYTIRIEENATTGDIIDLREITTYDAENLERLIEEGRDDVYNKRINALKEEHLKATRELEERKNREKEESVDNQVELYEEKIKNLLFQHTEELNKKDLENKNYVLSMQSNYEKEIVDLNNRLEKIESSSNDKTQLELVRQQQRLQDEYYKELENVKKGYEEKLEALQNQNAQLQREKISLNSKLIGEDLELWCDNRVKSHMQNGLFNCTWEKDNRVASLEGENQGSKADFIFKIYTDESKQEENLLTSVCLEMKDENPNSKDTHKKKDKDFFDKLNKNRNKKECQYAVLVSNLEGDNTSIAPIYRVAEYENMYVVRPAYMMVLLNLLVSIHTRFQTILLADAKMGLEIKEKTDLLSEFEELKTRYLEKPLDLLKNEIEKLGKANENIRKAANNIDEVISRITNSYINEIENKLIRFTRAIK